VIDADRQQQGATCALDHPGLFVGLGECRKRYHEMFRMDLSMPRGRVDHAGHSCERE
jgi:hypothetical protein